MSKDKLEVISAAQTERIGRVNAYHQGCIHAFTTQMGNAFLCGLELNQLKEEVGHGPWTQFRERYLPQVPERSAQRYMKFADALIQQNRHVADLKVNRLQITNGELPEKAKEEVLKAVHEAADGKTLTQFYRDLGVIRDKKEAGGEKRTYTAEEKVEAERTTAERIVDATIEQINTCKGFGKTEGLTIRTVKASKRKELLAASVAFNKVIRKFLKGAK